MIDEPLMLAGAFTLGMSMAFSSPDMFRRWESDASVGRMVALTLGLVTKLSPASIALVYSLGAIALSGWAAAGFPNETLAPVLDVGLQASGIGLLLEYLVRVGRLAQAGARVRACVIALRCGQALALLHVALAFHFGAGAQDVRDAITTAELITALPLLLAALVGGISAVVLSLAHVDEPEQIRSKAVALALPLYAFALLEAGIHAAVAMTVADGVLLCGAIHHLLTDAERGQFLGQFLAPQVAQLVRLQGIDAITTQKPMEVSIVCCDPRGYTAMTESAGAARVLELLGNYYDAVGAAVAEAGGTIKDQAGDGILILVGAPLPVADHATRALALARKLRAVGAQLRRDWEPRGLKPGLGVGVATGQIVAGAIGRATRLEYTAVGEPVNLSARLCSQAADGEVLADPRTIAAAGSSAGSFETRAPMNLKGISKPVAVAALVDAA